MPRGTPLLEEFARSWAVARPAWPPPAWHPGDEMSAAGMPGYAHSLGATLAALSQSTFYTEWIWLETILRVKYCSAMPDKRKRLTVQDAGRRGGKARAKKYSSSQLREWAKLGGWPKGRSRKKKRGTRKRGKP